MHEDNKLNFNLNLVDVRLIGTKVCVFKKITLIQTTTLSRSDKHFCETTDILVLLILQFYLGLPNYSFLYTFNIYRLILKLFFKIELKEMIIFVRKFIRNFHPHFFIQIVRNSQMSYQFLGHLVLYFSRDIILKRSKLHFSLKLSLLD